MRKVPDTAPSRQSRNRLPQAEGNFDMVAARMKVAAMPEAAPIRSRLRATCPFSRAFWRRRGVACSVWFACAIRSVGGSQLPAVSDRRIIGGVFHKSFFERARLQPGRCGPHEILGFSSEEAHRQ